MTLPFGPMTSPILSIGISKLIQFLGRHQEDAARTFAIDLGDQGGLAFRVVIGREVGDDARNEHLEIGVPPILAGVQLAMLLDDPSKVTRLVSPANRHTAL